MNPTPISLLPKVRWRNAAVGAGIAVVAALSVGVAAALWLSREPPAWWRPMPLDNPETRQAAVDLENGLTTLLSRGGPKQPATTPGVRTTAPTEPATPSSSPRQAQPSMTTTAAALARADDDPPQRWKMGIKASDANAWLNLRLPKWLANQDGSFKWPEEVKELQVDFRDQRLYVGARLVSGGRERVVSARLAPEFHADGSLWMPAEWVMIGKIGVPAAWLLDDEGEIGIADGDGGGGGVQEEVPDDLRDLPQTQGVLLAFAGHRAVMTNPVIKLGDGRRVRLLSLDAKDGRLIIECQTESNSK